MGSSGQKTKGLFANICQAYKNQLCTARENALRKKEAKLKAACINFATVPREGWGDYLEAVYAVLSGE